MLELICVIKAEILMFKSTKTVVKHLHVVVDYNLWFISFNVYMYVYDR